MSNVRLTKKPVTINGASVSDLLYQFKYQATSLPDWVVRGHNEGKLLFSEHTLMVKTIEGNYTVDSRWWLLEGVKGELYPCREDILWETYDKAEEQ